MKCRRDTEQDWDDQFLCRSDDGNWRKAHGHTATGNWVGKPKNYPRIPLVKRTQSRYWLENGSVWMEDSSTTQGKKISRQISILDQDNQSGRQSRGQTALGHGTNTHTWISGCCRIRPVQRWRYNRSSPWKGNGQHSNLHRHPTRYVRTNCPSKRTSCQEYDRDRSRSHRCRLQGSCFRAIIQSLGQGPWGKERGPSRPINPWKNSNPRNRTSQ